MLGGSFMRETLEECRESLERIKGDLNQEFKNY